MDRRLLVWFWVVLIFACFSVLAILTHVRAFTLGWSLAAIPILAPVLQGLAEATGLHRTERSLQARAKKELAELLGDGKP